MMCVHLVNCAKLKGIFKNGCVTLEPNVAFTPSLEDPEVEITILETTYQANQQITGKFTKEETTV